MSEINEFLRFVGMGYPADVAYRRVARGHLRYDDLVVPPNVTISVVPVPGTQQMAISNQHGTITTRR